MLWAAMLGDADGVPGVPPPQAPPQPQPPPSEQDPPQLPPQLPPHPQPPFVEPPGVVEEELPVGKPGGVQVLGAMSFSL